MHIQKNRRKGGDRRNSFTQANFPLIDASGVIVIFDRRQNPERRVNSIETQWAFEKQASETNLP